MDYLITSIGQDYTAYILSFLCFLFWMCSLVVAAENPKMNFAQFNIWRGFSIVLFTCLYAQYKKIPLEFKNLQKFKLLSFRSILSLLHTFFIPFSIHYLSQPLIQTITCASPIIVFILDYFINNIQIDRRQFCGIIAVCFSLLIMINSTLIMWLLGYSIDIDSKYQYIHMDIYGKTIISCVLLIFLIAQSYAVILTKQLKQYTVLEININIGFFALVIATILSFYCEGEPLNFSQSIYSFLTVGIFTTISMVCFNLALTITKKLGNVTIIGFTSVIHGYLLSILRYQEMPNMIEIIGSIIMLVGLVFVLIK